MTKIKTAKSAYTVESIEAPSTGPHFLVVRQPSGKVRRLGLADVGRPRFDAAIANYFSEQHRDRV